jgi:hypothetical protein
MRKSGNTGQSTNPEFARSLAVSALMFLAADQDRLRKFLNATGLGPQNLREAAADPAFHGSVLEYQAADERLLVDFASDSGVAPETVVMARQVLRASSAAGEQ